MERLKEELAEAEQKQLEVSEDAKLNEYEEEGVVENGDNEQDEMGDEDEVNRDFIGASGQDELQEGGWSGRKCFI